jgi:hypothetical protein
VTEIQANVNVMTTTRIARDPMFPDREIDSFGHQLEWNLGVLRNVSNEWAFGPVGSWGTGSVGALTGVRLRARRWMGPDGSAEFEGGAVATDAGVGFSRRALWGPTIGARLNWGDHASVLIRWNAVDAPAAERASGIAVDAGFEQGIHFGLSLGHTWAAGTTAILAALAGLLAYSWPQ